MVLIHIPARQQLLEAMAAALRPGGWLVIEDGDTFPAGALASGAYAELWGSLTAAFETAGMHPTWGRDLPGIFDRLGLEEVDAECDAGFHRGGGTFTEVMTVSLTQVRPLLLAAGATEALIDDTVALMADPTQWFPGWGLMCARGRAPGV